MENPDEIQVIDEPQDLRASLEAAFEDDVKPDEAAEPNEPIRDEAGKFAAKPVEAADDVAGDVTPDPVEAAPERRAPSSWKPDAQAAFNELPDTIKDEVLRRETDYHKGIEGYKTHAQSAQAFERAVQPFMQTINQLGVDAPTAVGQLLQADNTLRYGDAATKVQLFTQLAQQYGVDLSQVANPQPIDPQYAALQQQIQRQSAEMQRWKHDQEQQQNSVVMSEIDRFAADPAHTHFNEVRDEMRILLESGKAATLKDAYDTAVWMRGDIRQSLIDQQRAEAQKKAIDQAQNARVKAASVSVKGSSPANAGLTPVKGSLRDTLEAAFADS